MGFDRTFLHFTAADIREIAGLQGIASFNEEEAEQLSTLFDGWIAGILLGTRLGNMRMLRSRKEVHPPLRILDIQVDRHHLFAYFVNEVFSRGMENYTFLKGVAILRQMTPTLCNALLERTDAADRLQYLEQQGLFVTRTEERSHISYTCHPVLRELLCDELRSQSPNRFVSLHQHAMELWHAAHDFEQSIYHAFEANLDDQAAHLILEVQEQLFAQGNMEMLSRWIDTLPSRTIMRYPELLLVRAKLYLLVGEHSQALPLLEMTSESITQQPSLVKVNELPLLQVAISIASSEALFQKAEYIQAQKLCERVIEQLPMNEVVLRAEAHTLLGVCANELGDYTSGIAHLQKALQLWGRNSERWQTAKLHNTLARTYGLIGNYALAEHHLSLAARCWERLQDEKGKVNNLLNMGMIKQRQGEFASAETLFQKALTIARDLIHSRRAEGYALANLGDLYQEQGLYDQSLAVTEDGLALAHQLKDEYLINCTRCTLAMIYLLMGDAETAMLFVSEVNLENPSERSSGYERANWEIARGTILLYQRKYDEAYTCLTELENYLRTIGLKWELFCTILLLIECLLSQKRIPEMLHSIEEIDSLIPHNNYKQKVRRELRLLPTLERAIHTMPELARLRTILLPELAAEEKQDEWHQTRISQPSNLITTNVVRIKILALGEPSILIDDRPIRRWRVTRALELFFLLLNRDCPVSKEQIITALWSEVDERINQTLHSMIHDLRKLLGESCIVSHAGTYQLNLASLYGEEIWYDVVAFQEHHARAREALASNDNVRARKELTAMINLYRGDYLQSIYNDWSSFQRDELRLAYLNAHQQLALIAWRSEQFDESILHYQRMLAIDDCLENAHYGLMRCYMRQGKRGLALRQYQRCADVLRHEMSIGPGPAMQNLLQQLVKPTGTKSL
ncbi:MAG TPA: BTAD domain-containing putative transcriptional regulator [Ktedonobacteraceae bacterium]|nr:BTAD domain-containing putative transcriptional regulator [Ktedonobacteraceae bacterium]